MGNVKSVLGWLSAVMKSARATCDIAGVREGAVCAKGSREHNTGDTMRLRFIGLLVGLFASGCAMSAADPDGTPESDVESVAETSKALYGGSGAIQATGSSKIFWLYSSGGVNRVCWIKDPGQVAALQHISNPAWQGVPTVAEWKLKEDRVYEGHCRYPTNQMYRNRDRPEVYHMRGDHTYCWVSSNAQVNARGGWGAVLVINTPQSQMGLDEYGWADSNDIMNYWSRSPFVGACP